MKKRILALALSLCMMLSMMPTAYAGEGFLTLDGQQPEVSQPQEQPQQQEGFLTLDGQLPESDEPSRQPEEGVLTLDQPDLEVQEPTTPIIPEESEQNEGVLFVQCDFCGYLDGNHADDCATQQPEEEIIVVKPAAERKAAIVYSFTYQDTFDALMEADTLSVFESILDELTASQLEEFYDLLSDDDLDALDEQEDELAQAAVSDFKDEDTTKKTVTVETRVSAFGGAQREMLRQLGYELIVDMFGWIVDAIDLPQNDYTVMEAVSPETSADYQWQILADDDLWVDIYNETDSLIRVSYAMVANLLDRYDAVQVRCEITGEDGISYTDPVEVTVDYTSEDVIIDAETEPVVEDLIVEEGVVEDVVIEEPIVEEPIVEEPIVEEPIVEEPIVEEPIVEEPIVEEPIVEEPIVEEPIVEEPIVEEPIVEEPIVEEPVAQTFSVTRLGGTYAQPFTISLLTGTDGETTPAAETPDLGEYSIVVNYQFENNEIVTEAYTATLAQGSNFSATVTFPEVQGYLPYLGNDIESSTSLKLDVTNIQADVTYTVTYKPTNVNYTVIHYQQNIDNDNYTEFERETLQGLTKSTVPEVAQTYPGFYALLYEKPEIAADGSTKVEIYYDRYYYLINFDMGDGGYGTEPIYARYGVELGKVTNPTRAGYTFKGWSLNGTDIVQLPDTMPAKNVTYKAVWSDAGTVNYTIVYWKENANDANYSFWGSETETATAGSVVSGSDSIPASIHAGEKKYFTYDAALTSNNITVEGDGSTVVNVYYKRNTYTLTFVANELTCGKDAHSHDDSCANCGKVAHEHSCDECCTKTGFHLSHNIDKCPYNKEEHSHSASCYSCGKEEHSHSDGSWGSSDCYGSSKTVKTITAKYQQDIRSYFPIVGTNNASYTGYWWEVPNNATFFDPGTYVVSIDTMPGENLTFDGSYKGVSAKIYYYVEALPGATGTTAYEGKQFTLYKTVITNQSGKLTYLEEFHDINGFTQWKSNPAFSSHDADGRASTQAENFMYYTRNTYRLKFYNYNAYLTDKEAVVQYQKSLEPYNVAQPPYPANIDPNAFVFEGWYTTEACVEGTKVDLAALTMPASDLTLYANWVPKTHKIEFYLDKEAFDAGIKLTSHPDVTVAHNSKVTPEPNDPEKGSYTFVGWFYQNENGEEKAFDFDQMPVTKDMQVYGKWSSNVLKEYTVYYKIQGTDTEIADPIKGSGLAGVTKTFDAKGGTELDEGYQEGYFPLIQSHSMTLDINATEENDTNVYTFWYVQKDAVPYIVRYVDGDGNTLVDQKIVAGNRKAVVTETFKPVSGYLPDAYQKRLVLTGTDAEEWVEVTVGEETIQVHPDNIITFKYSKDDKHAYYKITHYTENTEKNADGESTWTEYASSQIIGNIGETCTAEPLKIDGFTYSEELSTANGKLTADGLELKLYYTRNSYPYEVRYLEKDTAKVLADPKTNVFGLYGQVISERAIGIADYTAVDPTSQTLTILREESQTEAKLNIITFYYTEKEATINYEVVGPTGCGSVNPTSETVKVLTETASGSTATAGENYHFVGWYSDADCTKELTEETEFVPEKVDGKNVAATYYAKFEEDQVTITYVAVGNGSVSPESETLGVVSGTATGSTATPAADHHFVGWYDNAECTGATISTNVEFKPAKVDGKNVAKTYYAKFEEDMVTITYVAVGPEGAVNFGTVDPTSETVKVLTEIASGSTATAGENYHFVGWYSDAACTQAVGASLVDANNKFSPAKVDNKNVEATYYAKFEENEATINYVAVGPEGCGTVTPASETVKVITGTATGSTASASSNVYKFVGWYNNAACTGEPISTNAIYVPTKAEGAVWTNTTYYAKFEYNLTSLTIKKEAQKGTVIDSDQTFVFKIVGSDGFETSVIIKGEGSVTITGLTVGVEYTVTEDTSWSWRYTPAANDQKITLVANTAENEISFANKLTNNKWLTFLERVMNVFGTANKK